MPPRYSSRVPRPNDLPPSLGRNPHGTGAPAVDLPAVGPEHAWERQPRECDQAWALFAAYRDSAYPEGLGGGYVVRHLPDFARAGQWDLRQIRNIAESFDWANRAIQYDCMVDQARTVVALDQLPEVIDDHKRLLKTLRRLLQDQMGKWLTVCETHAQPQIKVRELKALLDIGIKLDRLTYGESTEIIKLEGEWNLEGASLAQLKALRDVAESCGAAVEETLH